MIEHIGFTGTQRGMSLAQRATVHLLLRLAAPRRCVGPADEVWAHHGDCVGADKDFAELAVLEGLKIHRHPPTESGKRSGLVAWDRTEEPLPYLQRNDAIIAACGLLVACPKGFESEIRSGTWATIRHAGKAGRTTLIVWPDGSVEYRPGSGATAPSPIGSAASDGEEIK